MMDIYGDPKIYLGPFILFLHQSVDKVYKIRCCTNKKCHRVENEVLHTVKFCDNCGSKISKKSITKQVSSADLFDIEKATDNALRIVKYTSTSCIIILNDNIAVKGRSTYFTADSSEVRYLENLDRQDEINWLIEYYAKQIRALEKLASKENIMFHWGLIV